MFRPICGSKSSLAPNPPMKEPPLVVSEKLKVQMAELKKRADHLQKNLAWGARVVSQTPNNSTK